jgi:polysaccharide deacetylase 2 family uncharacterized protein YibQ
VTSDPLAREIERPLGVDRPPPRAGRSIRIPWLGAILTLAIVGSSTAIALRDRQLRTPPPPATEVAAAPDSLLPPAATVERPAGADGPAIIKVAPPPANQTQIVISDPSAIGQNLRVAHIPDRALIEESEYGPLPVRAADGRRPFDVYARPWSGARGARIALVIGGVGVSQTGTQQALERLPPEITMAFATGGNSLDRWMQTARRGGHEIVLQLPLEPFDYPNVDPGRDTLTVDADPAETLDRLHRSLARITNYTGVMNYMGGRFVADRASMNLLMEELGRRGLMYFDDGSTARSLSEPLAGENRVPFAANDSPIDGVRETKDIMKKLDELERVARARGFAIGTGSAFQVTVDAVTKWVAEAKRRGIEIVPLSALADDPGRG